MNETKELTLEEIRASKEALIDRLVEQGYDREKLEALYLSLKTEFKTALQNSSL